MRMRVAPDGPFVREVNSNQDPLQAGPGTEGIVYHAIGEGPAQVLLGAGSPLQVTWENPQGGASIQTLPWTLEKNKFWEVRFATWVLEGVANPGGNFLVRTTAADAVTAVRSTLTEQTLGPVPIDFTLWPIQALTIVNGTGWANDYVDVQVEVEGSTDLSLPSLLTVLTYTQYVP